jgi:hypothetical protein
MKNLESKFSVSGDSMVPGAVDFYCIATELKNCHGYTDEAFFSRESLAIFVYPFIC